MTPFHVYNFFVTRRRESKFHIGKINKSDKGFTLVEMIVAVGLLSIVMLVATGALLALVSANRKAQALQSVMNNLNITLDGMVRALREGNNIRCNTLAQVGPDWPNCPNGGHAVYFEAYGGSGGNAADDWVYWYDSGTHRLYKSEDATNLGAGYPVTAPEITIDSMNFYIVGATPHDTTQPKVVIVIKGTAGAANVKTRSTFSIQATAVQRALDI